MNPFKPASYKNAHVYGFAYFGYIICNVLSVKWLSKFTMLASVSSDLPPVVYVSFLENTPFVLSPIMLAMKMPNSQQAE